jgi:hypothetical protein
VIESGPVDDDPVGSPLTLLYRAGPRSVTRRGHQRGKSRRAADGVGVEQLVDGVDPGAELNCRQFRSRPETQDADERGRDECRAVGDEFPDSLVHREQECGGLGVDPAAVRLGAGRARGLDVQAADRVSDSGQAR